MQQCQDRGAKTLLLCSERVDGQAEEEISASALHSGGLLQGPPPGPEDAGGAGAALAPRCCRAHPGDSVLAPDPWDDSELVRSGFEEPGDGGRDEEPVVLAAFAAFAARQAGDSGVYGGERGREEEATVLLR